MKIKAIKSTPRLEPRNDRSLGVQTYGENNDYPQRVRDICGVSGTGKSCLRTYYKFINGRGFTDKGFYKAIINDEEQTTDYILSQISRDYAQYGGFALHVNYNGLYKIVTVQHVPFETIRFQKLDDNAHFEKVATHPDWARQNTALRPFKKEDIKWYDLFNPNPLEIEKQINLAGGIDKWSGQIYYYSDAGEKTYPLPVFDAVLTDMSTEEGVSNVKYRNARNNFFPAGAFVDKRNKPQTDKQEEDFEEMLLQVQTDEKSCKIMSIKVESEEEIPQFIPFQTQNYDKEFTYTESSIKNNIGEAFNQPPILRARDVGANFGADLMTNAYNFYNSVTDTERYAIERVFSEIFMWFYKPINPTNNYSILPLTFNIQVNVNNG